MSFSPSPSPSTSSAIFHNNIHNHSSNNFSDPLDPTTLAISLIPLLPPNISSQINPLSLPLLAASLSTLPPSVINVINHLAQDLKSLREQLLLSLNPSNNSNFTQPDSTDHEQTRESRERWLENQKVNHLKKSISSLTSLHASVQSRLLTTVDTLSDLQQMHKRDTQQLTDERDGVRAVNRVLKRKIIALENQLGESKQIMESVLERVELVNKGDWSIIQHGAIELFSPVLPSPSAQADHESSTLTEDLCSFHQQCQADLNNHAPTPHSASHHPNFLGSVRSGLPNNLVTSVGSESHHNQRSLTLIVELTEELESLRQAIKVELQAKQDEISVLKGLVEYRDSEITRLMGRLEHFMGLDGFYVCHEDDKPQRELARSVRSPTGDAVGLVVIGVSQSASQHTWLIQATSLLNLCQRLSRKPPLARTRTNSAAASPSNGRPPSQPPSPIPIRCLKSNSRPRSGSSRWSSTKPPKMPPRMSCTIPAVHRRLAQTFVAASGPSLQTRPARYLPRPPRQTRQSDQHALSRALADLSTQVVDLKYALKEVSTERDTLKRLQAKQKSHHGTATHQPDQQIGGSHSAKGLKEALERSRSECARLQRLLAQSEGRVMELERRLGSQEAEFEQVAERVQDKLQDQRSKLVQAKAQIDQLEAEINEVRLTEVKTRQELSEERRRVEMLKRVIEQRAGSRKKTDKEHCESSESLSAAAVRRTSKDPFLASGASSSSSSKNGTSVRGSEKRRVKP